ncbi:MAG: hypothetical protein AB7S48_05765 [Bacteroidales bacterium]
MKNVTFLIGAGASKNALPIVSEISDRIDNAIELFEKDDFKLSESEKYDDLDKTTSKREHQLNFIADLKWLAVESRNHASIDTFAKKLLVKQKRIELLKLKGVLSIFFILEQFRNSIDKRYDTFFASILGNHTDSLPSLIKVINWNYDFQFEKSYSEYTNDEDIDSNSYRLNVVSKFSKEIENANRFSIFKLNGTTTLRDRAGFRTYRFYERFNGKIDLGFIDQLIKNYIALLTLTDRVLPNLSFAWEKENLIVESTIKGTSSTEILVVIGYSFPFFNREIDRTIINSMNSLEKVYFQSPDADALKERFLSIRNDIKTENLISKYDTSQFFLPNEL